MVQDPARIHKLSRPLGQSVALQPEVHCIEDKCLFERDGNEKCIVFIWGLKKAPNYTSELCFTKYIDKFIFLSLGIF